MVQRLIHLATALSPLAAAIGVKGRFPPRIAVASVLGNSPDFGTQGIEKFPEILNCVFSS